MKCREIEGDLSAYLAEEADPALCRSIKAHLKGCKKCRSRIAALKAEKEGPKKAKEVAISSEKIALSPRERSSGFPSTSGMLSALWHRPVEITVTIVLVGGTLFLYQRGASVKADFSMTENGAAPAAEAVVLSAPAENHEGTQEKETPISPPSIIANRAGRSAGPYADEGSQRNGPTSFDGGPSAGRTSAAARDQAAPDFQEH
ncbi:MAG: zf-HC2 domain-containing protein [Candidatus Manganitrophus sp.]|nr:MAG: zf-HC2 domain-containing protein [Candidatus Manganitrophus sp.]